MCQQGDWALKGGEHEVVCQQGDWALKGGEHEMVCQQGRWPRRGVAWGGPTSIGEGNECQRGCWASKEGGLWDPTSVGEKNETFFINVWKPPPSKRVLKTLRERSKWKSQRGQYLLAVAWAVTSTQILLTYFDNGETLRLGVGTSHSI